MQDQKIRIRIYAKGRRIFRFKSGLYVEVYFHEGLRSWAAEAFRENQEDPLRGKQFWATTLDLKGPDGKTAHVASPRWAVKQLRRAVAEKENPALKKVTQKLVPGNERLLTPQELKALNMGRLYGMGPKRMGNLLGTIV